MSELPKGWVTAALGDVCEQPAQRVPSADEEFTYIDIASIDRERKIISEPQRLPGAEAPSRARKLVKTGDVIVSMTRPNLNAVALVGEEHNECIASTGFDVLKPIEVEPRWVFAAARSAQFVNAMCDKVQGALYPAVKAADIREHEIPLPPLAEQTRIAAKLDELLVQVDSLKARIDGIPARLKRFRQSVLAAAVSGRLTEEWRAGNPYAESAEQQVAKVDASKTGRLKVRKAETGFSDDQLFVIPDGWGWVENHRLAEDSNTAICAGPFGTIFKAKDFRDAGVPIIFLRHVAEGVYKTEKPGFMDEAVWEELHQEYSVYGGELLVTKLGDPPGTACLYPQGIGTAMVTPDVIKMSVDERVALPKYLMFFFNSQHCKGLIEKLAFGATRLRIDIAMFKGFPIPLPPLEEQTEILQRVEQLFAFADQLDAKVAAAKSRIDHLTQSILAKAFRGELVPQDPNDEPASVLLERIKAQRAATPKAKRGRKASA